MKIYSKTGDEGKTSLIGGTRVVKFDDQIETYGTLDELNSFIGAIRDYKIDAETKKIIIEIQNIIMNCSSLIAADDDFDVSKLPQLTEGDIEFLENQIDKIDNDLPQLTSFILPGGSSVVTACHISRTVCRRAERQALYLSVNRDVNPLILKYLNRLSDYLFVLARKLSIDFNAEEIEWKG